MAYNATETLKHHERIYNDFLKKYGATARVSQRREAMYRYEPLDFKSDYFNTTVHYENMFEIEITETALKKLIDDSDAVTELERMYGPNSHRIIQNALRIDSDNNREARARRDNPAVQLAWEKYQMLLKIAGDQ